MLTKRESLAETRLPLKINLCVTIWTSAIWPNDCRDASAMSWRSWACFCPFGGSPNHRVFVKNFFITCSYSYSSSYSRKILYPNINSVMVADTNL